MTIRRVFVTGGTGFIGKHLVEHLVGEGYLVGLLIRTSRLENEEYNAPNVELFTGDIRNYEDIQSAFSMFRPDAVLHLVTYYAVMHRADEIGVMLDTNVKGTVNILEAARDAGVQLFVNASTCAVYEQKNQSLRESDPVKPQNLYAVTKLQAEEACEFYADNFSLPVVSLRLFPPYGPGDKERRLIPHIIDCLNRKTPPQLTSGTQKWDFVYVTDIARAFVAVIKKAPFEAHHEIINIGTGEPYSVRSVGTMIQTAMGSNTELCWGAIEHRMNEVWCNSADSGKAMRVLGWEPRTPIEDGLEMTIAYFRDHFRKNP